MTTLNTRTHYDIGDRPSAVGTFLDVDLLPATPTAVTVKVRTPAGIVTTYSSPHATITLGSTTVFEMPDPVDASGTWTVNMTATAGVEAAAEIEFIVRRSKFP